MDKDMLNAFREILKEELEPIKLDINELKKGQEDLKTIIGELDPKNANRHLELQNSISELRKSLSTVEIVTASNYSDLAKLKSAR